MSAPTTSAWQVEGMTCGHCVAAVTEELTALDGVRTVEVVLETGAVTVTSDDQLDRVAVAAAVEEAGYRLVS
ncbi:cation transporter [Nocardioides conyzicola]|uniref:Heavy-metal-associated domain-containing protein n=1 Tax=Nocardioides conyzicola TaxID=1651781 RepID=A0ABP8XJI8_9ACTN